MPIGALGCALAGLLLVAMLRGCRLSVGLMVGSPDRSAWLVPVLATTGAVAALALWGRRPAGAGWMLTGAGAVLVTPCAAVFASGAALRGDAGQLVIGLAAAPAGAVLSIGVLATGRMLWLSGWRRAAAAVFAGGAVVQLVPAGLLDQQLGAAAALRSGVASTVGVVAPLSDPAYAGGGSNARMAAGVLLLAAVVLALAAGVGMRSEQRLGTVRGAERRVSGRLLAIGIAGTAATVVPPMWLGLIGLRPFPWSDSESVRNTLEQSVRVALLGSGLVLLLVGLALVTVAGPAITKAVLPAALGLALVGSVAPILQSDSRPPALMFAAVVLGAVAGMVAATQRFAGVIGAVLVVLFAAVLVALLTLDESLESTPDFRATLLAGGMLIAVAAGGAITGSAFRRLVGASESHRPVGWGAPSSGAGRLRPESLADALVVGVGVLLPLVAGGAGKLVLGLTM
ncbi:hypothetical protein [Nakamurella aerolata]|uniref:Uncharacterized protein n=1 Tax=Nakamurella aerolata TaxID=1656892 RepID=A0A849AGY9_9ACTN|nr:hypothetical protein [Nakamurella aerolata]NNG36112.1 hypothetical protein [Nakamurella aerolata]